MKSSVFYYFLKKFFNFLLENAWHFQILRLVNARVNAVLPNSTPFQHLYAPKSLNDWISKNPVIESHRKVYDRGNPVSWSGLALWYLYARFCLIDWNSYFPVKSGSWSKPLNHIAASAHTIKKILSAII